MIFRQIMLNSGNFKPNRLILNIAFKFSTKLNKQISSEPISSFLINSDKKASKISEFLLTYGFSKGQVTYILNSSHTILSLSKEDLSSNLLSWYTFDGNNKLFTVLTRYPELLTLNPQYIEGRSKELMSIFTKKDINKLLLTCPKVFLDDFNVVEEKVQYIVHEMGVEQKSIVKCGSLQFELEHIKCRHLFMSRAGLYKVKKKAVLFKTPPLSKIFSKNMKTFLELSGLTEEEYKAFGRALQFEIEHMETEDDDSDEES